MEWKAKLNSSQFELYLRSLEMETNVNYVVSSVKPSRDKTQLVVYLRCTRGGKPDYATRERGKGNPTQRPGTLSIKCGCRAVLRLVVLVVPLGGGGGTQSPSRRPGATTSLPPRWQ
jgi:hypothetical protein